jgi:anthranilate phosphoribosyltransferase
MDAVTINAAATIWCAELCNTLAEGIKIAKHAISTGKTLKILDAWKIDSHL